MESVQDIDTYISIHKDILDMKQQEREYYQKLLHKLPQGYPCGTSYNDYDTIHSSRNDMSFSDIVSEIYKLNSMIEVEENIIEVEEKKKKEIYKKINKLKGIEYKIEVMRTIQGKSLQEIADELDYSYGYIKNISTKIRKEKA